MKKLYPQKYRQIKVLYLINIIDTFSKFAVSYLVTSKEGKIVAEKLEDFITTHGAPIQLLSDNGLEFVNINVNNICEKYNIEHIKGRPYHPQT